MFCGFSCSLRTFNSAEVHIHSALRDHYCRATTERPIWRALLIEKYVLPYPLSSTLTWNYMTSHLSAVTTTILLHDIEFVCAFRSISLNRRHDNLQKLHVETLKKMKFFNKCSFRWPKVHKKYIIFKSNCNFYILCSPRSWQHRYVVLSALQYTHLRITHPQTHVSFVHIGAGNSTHLYPQNNNCTEI